MYLALYLKAARHDARGAPAIAWATDELVAARLLRRWHAVGRIAACGSDVPRSTPGGGQPLHRVRKGGGRHGAAPSLQADGEGGDAQREVGPGAADALSEGGSPVDGERDDAASHLNLARPGGKEAAHLAHAREGPGEGGELARSGPRP